MQPFFQLQSPLNNCIIRRRYVCIMLRRRRRRKDSWWWVSCLKFNQFNTYERPFGGVVWAFANKDWFSLRKTILLAYWVAPPDSFWPSDLVRYHCDSKPGIHRDFWERGEKVWTWSSMQNRTVKYVNYGMFVEFQFVHVKFYDNK